ncbi:MAG: DUF1343 domain-containing protein [Bacteroidales bacterium]|nr:DUF1343 domain-containing protein [Bacteroidales bacterium]
MFSFRTSALEEQLDKALTEGRVGCFCSHACWDAYRGYTWEIFRSRGGPAKIMLPDQESGGQHIDFDLETLSGLDAVVVEIQDCGARNFNYTTDVLRLMSAMASLADAPALYVVDRPNPLGRAVEGTMPAGESDVWLPAVPHRHGLTLGELCLLYHTEIQAVYPLHIISATCSSSGRETMPWAVPPAPDIPGFFTSQLYYGASFWNETSICAGTGTNRPYEYIGAPFIKNTATPPPTVPGVILRPCSFVPSSGIYEGEECRGWQLLLLPGVEYKALAHTLLMMRHFAEHYSAFTMSDGLFTALADPVIGEFLHCRIDYDIVEEHIKSEEQKWIRKARRFLLYPDSPYRIK